MPVLPPMQTKAVKKYVMTDRREFIKKASLGVGALSLSGGAFAGSAKREKKIKQEKPGFFKLKYAPHLGMFNEHAGKDPIDNIKFINDQGFRAIFDNGLPKKDPVMQEKIAAELHNRNMEMGPFVAYADFKAVTFVEDQQEVRDLIKEKVELAVEVANRTGAKWALMVPGRFHDKLAWEYQTTNVINNLRYVCEQLDRLNSKLIIVLEPLNSHVNHPGLFLTKIPQSYMICQAVNDPRIKIVNDLYHQQIQEGNLINNFKMAYSEIAAFHVGDNPGRNEPTSGEINYQNIFKELYTLGYDDTICMEHGKSIDGIEGEKKLIEAYRYCDSFDV